MPARKNYRKRKITRRPKKQIMKNTKAIKLLNKTQFVTVRT